jgi:hypothetical protein
LLGTSHYHLTQTAILTDFPSIYLHVEWNYFLLFILSVELKNR